MATEIKGFRLSSIDKAIASGIVIEVWADAGDGCPCARFADGEIIAFDDDQKLESAIDTGLKCIEMHQYLHGNANSDKAKDIEAIYHNFIERASFKDLFKVKQKINDLTNARLDEILTPVPGAFVKLKKATGEIEEVKVLNIESDELGIEDLVVIELDLNFAINRRVRKISVATFKRCFAAALLDES